MSIEASTSREFRALGERLLEAARRLEEGSPHRDADPTWDLTRAVSAYINEAPAYDYRLAMALRSENEAAAKEHPFGRLILHLLTMSKAWTGSAVQLEEAGVALGLSAQINTELLHVRHWFSRGISAAGALAYVGEDGDIHLVRHPWFSLAGRTAPTLPVRNGTRSAASPKRSRRSMVRARGIDPEICIYCLSAPFEEIEHFVPRSRGGTNDLSNLFPSCIECNRGRGTGKHDKDPWEWLATVHPRRLAYFQEFFGVEPIDN